MQSLTEFNTLEPIGSIYEHSFRKHQLGSWTSKCDLDLEKAMDGLVHIIAYCLNPNHFHLILEQVSERGIEKFMQRFGTGYTKYFNNRHERSGALFQGRFKAVHIDSNAQLLHLSVYVNLNFRVHQYPESALLHIRSSWDEYTDGRISNQRNLCHKEKVLGQFRNTQEYELFANQTLPAIRERKIILKGDSLE
jgi:REP element-mobilizing transposase RayT